MGHCVGLAHRLCRHRLHVAAVDRIHWTAHDNDHVKQMVLNYASPTCPDQLRNEDTINSKSALAFALLLPFSALACGAEESPDGTASQPPAAHVGSTATHNRLPTDPADIGHGREPLLFDSLAAMNEAADLVVVGDVVSVVPGRSVAGFQYRVNEMHVTQYIKGQPTDSNVLVEEVGWLGDEPWTFNDAAWASTGDKVIMALVKKEEETWEGRTVYRLASTQSRFFFDANGDLRSNYLEHAAPDPFVEAQLSKDRDALISDLIGLTAASQ